MKLADFLEINDFYDFKNQKKIKEENEQEIYSYYKNRYSCDNPPFYHCVPIYNTIINNNQFMYIVVEFDNDSVYFQYKMIQILKTKQIRIIDTPISINGITDNETIVIKKLKQIGFVKFVYKENFINKNISNDGECSEYNDYYYNFYNNKYNGHYKQKHYINKMKNNKDFKISIIVSVDKKYISPLRDTWVKGMCENGQKVQSKNTKDFYLITQQEDNRVVNIIISYKNQPISIQTLLIDNIIKFQDCLYINHMGRINSEDHELNMVLKNMQDIQNYIACEYLCSIGIKKMYIAGCRPNEKRLLKHKEKISDGVIRYYIDNNKRGD